MVGYQATAPHFIMNVMQNEKNPYAPPRSQEMANSLSLPGETATEKQRNLAVVILVFAMGVSAVVSLLDDLVVQTRIGPWPIIFASSLLAILSSFLTKNRVIAPMTCFGSVMCSAMLVAISHGLQFAQLHLALPIAAAFSVPSLLIASWLGRKD